MKIQIWIFLGMCVYVVGGGGGGAGQQGVQ